MINFERKNYLAAFTLPEAGWNDINDDGGIGLYELPSKYHFGFNPIIVRETRWKFLTDQHQPSYLLPVSYLKWSGRVITSDRVTTQTLYVTVDCDEGTFCVTLDKGKNQWTVSGITKIDAILGLSMYWGINEDDYSVTDASGVVWILDGHAYESEYLLADEKGNRLFRDTVTIFTSQVTIRKYDEDRSLVLAATSFAGQATFDFSSIVCSWFADELADLTKEGVEYIDRRLFTRYALAFPVAIGGSTSFDYMAVNAVAQVGESPVIDASVSQYRWELNRLPGIVYEGYPCERTYFNRYYKDPVGGQEVPESQTVTRTRIRSGSSYVSGCVPSAPFFVRWIGRNGAVEQYMFQRRQKEQPAVKSSSAYEPYLADTESARTNEIVYSLTTENRIVVGAEDVEDAVFQVLKAMPFSPEIEWYNETLGRWIRLGVSKFEGADYKDTSKHSMEITFMLPKINLQY